jgi:hypothetical protein
MIAAGMGMWGCGGGSSLAKAGGFARLPWWGLGVAGFESEAVGRTTANIPGCATLQA